MALEVVTTAPTTTLGGNAPPAAPVSKPEPAKPPEGKPAETTVDPRAVARIAQISREAREAKGKVSALEAALAEANAKVASTPAELKAKADRIDRLEAAKAANKPLDALKELGYEFEAIIQAQLDADPDAPASPEAVKALEEIEKLKAKDAERDKAAEEQKAREAQEAAAAANARTAAWVTEKIKSDPMRWELCAKADGQEGRENAVEEATIAVSKKCKQLDDEAKAKDPAAEWKPTREQAEALFVEALDLTEKWLERKGQLYTRQNAQVVQPSGKHHGGFTVTENDLDAPAPRAATIGNDRGPTRTLTSSRTQMTAREARERVLKALRE